MKLGTSSVDPSKPTIYRGHVSQKNSVLRGFNMTLLTPTPLPGSSAAFIFGSALKGGGWFDYMVGEKSPLCSPGPALGRCAGYCPSGKLIVSSCGDVAGRLALPAQPRRWNVSGAGSGVCFLSLTYFCQRLRRSRMFWKPAHCLRNGTILCSGKPFPPRP